MGSLAVVQTLEVTLTLKLAPSAATAAVLLLGASVPSGSLLHGSLVAVFLIRCTSIGGGLVADLVALNHVEYLWISVVRSEVGRMWIGLQSRHVGVQSENSEFE